MNSQFTREQLLTIIENKCSKGGCDECSIAKWCCTSADNDWHDTARVMAQELLNMRGEQ